MIRFSTNFPCGNGQLIYCDMTNGIQEIAFRAKTKFKEPQPNWFFFRVSDLSSDSLRFVFANAEQCLDDFGVIGWKENKPVFKVPGGEWQRVPQVEVEMLPNRCYKVWFDVHVQSNEVEVAYCYPYGWKQLQDTLRECVGLQSDIIGYSHNGRPILRVSTGYGDESRTKKSIYLVARQHAAEVSGAWITDGIMRFLNSTEGQALTKDQIWWLVPIIDPDGVEEGAYGKDQIIGDFNRSWGAPFPNRVELHAVQHDMDHLAEFSTPGLFLDMHSPGNDRHGIELLLKEDMNSREMSVAEYFCTSYNQFLKEAQMQEAVIKHTSSAHNTSAKTGMMGSVYAATRAGIPAVTLETSCWGPLGTDQTYTLEDYHRMGELIVRAVAKTLSK